MLLLIDRSPSSRSRHWSSGSNPMYSDPESSGICTERICFFEFSIVRSRLIPSSSILVLAILLRYNVEMMLIGCMNSC